MKPRRGGRVQALVREAGCFVIPWSQTEIDGLSGAPVDALRRGAAWKWQGDAVCLDAATGFSGLLQPPAARVMHQHAVARTREVFARAMGAEGRSILPQKNCRPQTVTLTDGPRRWVASLVDIPLFARPVILFTGDLPPRDVVLRVTVSPERPENLSPRIGLREGVVCFAQGTRLATPEGTTAIEDIVAGDHVVTKDGGPREVLWVGVRHLSRARLMTTPDLRPVKIASGSMDGKRPAGDLLVSPDHRMVVGTPVTRDIWNEIEVLVAARDLVGRRGVTRVPAIHAVTYYHVMLAEHGVLVANGIETESFHPGAAELDAIAEDQRTRLFDIMPDLAVKAANYGPPARRVLSAEEAAQLTQAN